MSENRTLNDKFMLRFPDGLRDRVKAAADANKRSMNAEIIARLEDTFGWEVQSEVEKRHDREMADLVQRLERAVERLTNEKPD